MFSHYAKTQTHKSMFANNVLLGSGGRVGVWFREQRKMKGITKHLMVNKDITG